MDWDRRKLFDLVRQRHGHSQAELLKPALISSVWKLFIAQYHADESKAILQRPIEHSTKEEYVEAAKLLFEQAAGTDKGREFALARFQAEANMIACAQSLHSLADIFSQVVYLSLNLDKNLNKPVPENKKYLFAVNKALSGLPRFSTLHRKINKLLKSNQFDYLGAYVNTTKHRSLIPADYSISFEKITEPMHGLKISGFEYKGNKYSSRWAKELLEDDLHFIRDCFANIGNEINSSVNLS